MRDLGRAPGLQHTDSRFGRASVLELPLSPESLRFLWRSSAENGAACCFISRHSPAFFWMAPGVIDFSADICGTPSGFYFQPRSHGRRHSVFESCAAYGSSAAKAATVKIKKDKQSLIGVPHLAFLFTDHVSHVFFVLCADILADVVVNIQFSGTRDFPGLRISFWVVDSKFRFRDVPRSGRLKALDHMHHFGVRMQPGVPNQYIYRRSLLVSMMTSVSPSQCPME